MGLIYIELSVFAAVHTLPNHRSAKNMWQVACTWQQLMEPVVCNKKALQNYWTVTRDIQQFLFADPKPSKHRTPPKPNCKSAASDTLVTWRASHRSCHHQPQQVTDFLYIVRNDFVFPAPHKRPKIRSAMRMSVAVAHPLELYNLAKAQVWDPSINRLLHTHYLDFLYIARCGIVYQHRLRDRYRYQKHRHPMHRSAA